MTRSTPRAIFAPRLTAFALAALSLIAITLGAQTADAQETWTVISFATRGIEANDAAAFKDLLQAELTAHNSAAFVESNDGQPCNDVPCAAAAGHKANAAIAIYGGLSALGRKIIVTATVVDVGANNVLSSQKMVVDNVEDLEAVATRMSKAILGGTNTDDTAELGSITEKEARVELRREGASGLGLRVGGIAPFSAGSADGKFGILFDFTYWYETSSFAIEPRIGLRTDTGDSDGAYFEMPIDVGAYYILGQTDFAPFFGGGAGLRFIAETRPTTVQEGEGITFTGERDANDSGWGFSMFARAGLLLFRTYSLRLAVTADYNITFLEVNDKSTPQSLTFGIGVLF